MKSEPEQRYKQMLGEVLKDNEVRYSCVCIDTDVWSNIKYDESK